MAGRYAFDLSEGEAVSRTQSSLLNNLNNLAGKSMQEVIGITSQAITSDPFQMIQANSEGIQVFVDHNMLIPVCHALKHNTT